MGFRLRLLTPIRKKKTDRKDTMSRMAPSDGNQVRINPCRGREERTPEHNDNRSADPEPIRFGAEASQTLNRMENFGSGLIAMGK